MSDTIETKNNVHKEHVPTLKHPEVFQLIQRKIGLKEDAQYKSLYKPTDELGESESLRFLAIRNFKRMAATLYNLIVTDEKKYDVIIGAGDSGIAMAELMKMVFQEADKPIPRVVNLPVVRYKYTEVAHPDGQFDRFDNSCLIPDTKAQLEDIGHIDNILFVDDEIKNAIPSSESVKLILDSVEPNNKADTPHVTIVAEDHGFKPEVFLDGVTAELYSYAEQIPNLMGVVGFIIPENIDRKIRAHFSSKEMAAKNRMNALLDLPSREKYEVEGLMLDRPKFSYDKTNMAKNEISDFSELQKEFREVVRKWVKEAIAEYKVA